METSASTNPTWTKSPWWKALAIVMALIGLTSLVPAFMATAFMFDDPSASSNPVMYLVAAAFLALPFLCIACAILPYVFSKREHARLIFLVPLLDFLLVPFFWYLSSFVCGAGAVCH